MILVGGCSSTQQPLALRAERAYRAADYDRVMWRWTRNARIFRSLNTPLRAYATLQAPDFSDAYAALRGKMFHLNAQHRKALREQLARRWQDGFDFVVAAATRDMRYNDFDRANSVWRITLNTSDRQQVDASEIRRVRPISPIWTQFYPYTTEFYQLYMLKFPRQLPDGRPLLRENVNELVLRFDGPLGHAAMTWKIQSQ